MNKIEHVVKQKAWPRNYRKEADINSCWVWDPLGNGLGALLTTPQVYTGKASTSLRGLTLLFVPSGEVSGFGTLPDLFQLGVPRFPRVYFLGLPPRENMML